METPAMKFSLARPVALLSVTTMLAAAPAWAQTVPQSAPDTAGGSPSGTSAKAAPHAARSASARRPGETMQSLAERRIAELHSRLQITPQQAEQWNRFAQVMRENAAETDRNYRQRADRLGAMSAVDNLQSYAELEQQRAQEIQKLVPAFQTLYGALSDQQKREADQMFRSYAANARSGPQSAAAR
jgi:hypothetical protein